MKTRFSKALRFQLNTGLRFNLKLLAWTSGIAITLFLALILGQVGQGDESKAFGHETWSNESSIINRNDSSQAVQLLHFNAEMNMENVLLSWATATENNNLHFTLYRSQNGKVYDELARLI